MARRGKGINRAAWSVEERAEEEALYEDVVARTNVTHERLDEAERLFADAIQAHRPWAASLEEHFIRQGLAAQIKAYQDRNKAMVSHDGQVLNLPRVQGVRATDSSGDSYYQRELIELCSWEQIAAKRLEAIRTRGTYDDKIAHYDKLLALRDLAPGVANPIEAAAALEIDLDDYLGVAA